MKLMIVGSGRSGKDTAAEWLHKHTRLRYWGSCSQVILPHAAQRLGQSQGVAWQTRHENREVWRQVGDKLREHDPAALARETLDKGNICVGVRSFVEVVAAKNLVDLTIWIERKVPMDDTLEFGPEWADIVIRNDWSISSFHDKLRNLSRSLGILKNSGTPVVL